jgi:hypothetical protein
MPRLVCAESSSAAKCAAERLIVAEDRAGNRGRRAAVHGYGSACTISSRSAAPPGAANCLILEERAAAKNEIFTLAIIYGASDPVVAVPARSARAVFSS